MRCLVLTMGCNQDFFIREEKKVRETWAKDILDKKYLDLDYFTYTASSDENSYIDYETHTIYISCKDDLYGTFEKTSKCFKLLNDEGILKNYDFIFRTNMSTYINVSLLNIFLHSDLIDNNLIYGGDIYCAKTACGPFNYSYYAIGNSIMIPIKYLILLNEKHLHEYFEKYYNVMNGIKDSVLNIDDNAIGFIINSFLEFEKGIYHKLIYRVIGNNRESIEKVNEYISTPLRIYGGDREQEFKLYDIINDKYNGSTDLKNIKNHIINTNNLYKMFI